MTTWFWFWLLLAAVLAVCEVVTSGLYLLPFAAGALAAAVLQYLGIDVSWQWGTFVGLSSVTLVLVQRLLRPSTRVRARVPADAVTAGRTAMVIERLSAEEGRGRVMLDDREWRAYAPGAEPVSEGTRVVVERAGKTYLIVRPDERDAAAASA